VRRFVLLGVLREFFFSSFFFLFFSHVLVDTAPAFNEALGNPAK